MMKNNKLNQASLVLITALMLAACGGSGDPIDETPTPPTPPVVSYPAYTDIIKSGGDTTILDGSNSGHGFSTPAVNLTAAELTQHLDGDVNFETSFTTAPNDEHPELDGLGPVA